MLETFDFYAAHVAVLEDIATGKPQSQVLESIVRMVERQSNDMYCTILLFDEANQCMRPGASPSIPAEYARALDGARIGPHEGSCGAAAARRIPIIVEDIATHPNWAVYKTLALPHGLRACWSTPIFGSDGSVLGTFAMYYRESRGPTEKERRWVSTATHVAALAIMHERAAEVDRERKRLVEDLGERVKELTLLHSATRLLEWRRPVDASLLRDMADLLPAGMRFPAACAARIEWAGMEARTEGWRASEWTISEPLVTADALGAIEVAYPEPPVSGDPFLPEEREVLRSLAELVSTHFGRVSAERALRDREERLGILYDLGEAMRQVSEPEEVLPVALRMLGEHLRTTRCQYADVDEDQEGLTIPHDWTDGIAANMAGRYRLSDFGPAIAEPLRRGGTLIIRNADEDLPAHERQVLGALDIKAFVACSLIRRGRVRALMSVHQGTPRRWTANDVAIIEAFVERCWATIEQRAAEAQIRRQAALLRIAGQAARLGGWSMEIPSLDISWSDEVCAIHEVPAGTQPTLQQVIEFLAVEWRDVVTSALEACVAEGAPFDLELQLVTASGRRSWVRAMGQAERDPDGTIVRVQGALQDVNDRRRLEADLHQAQKMEAVGQLAGGVAHDFNNLLSVILSSAEFAAGAVPPGTEAHTDIDEIRKAGRRAADLTGQLLTFSRKHVVTPTVLDMNQVLSGIERMLKRLLREDIGCAIVPHEALGHVRVDKGQLEQVIVNLVVNARDAMPFGGSVTIETSNVELDADYASRHHGVTPGEYAMLSVTDTGTGMDALTVTRIFEPFFTTKEKGKGTGLGLATVYGIVSAGGGHVSVDSEIGRGTTFRIYLPRVDEAASDLDADDHEPLSNLHGSETVLVVEDAEQVRAIIRSILQRNGYRVLEAENAGEALLVAEQHAGTIDLLLTDVVLPRVSGRTLAERLRAQRPQLRVLYTSGYAAEALLSGPEAGDGFLPKPITPESLLHAVRRMVDRAPRERAGEIARRA